MDALDPRHGTYAGYQQGCRERCCREGAANYQRGRYFDRAVLGLPPRCVDKTGTMRRVQALQRIGWSAEDLSVMLGRSRAFLNVTINRDARRGVHRRTAESVAALYDRLSMTVGPSEVTRQRAAARGWPPPLAWDDDTIDDPNAEPHGIRTSDTRDLLTEWHDLRDAGESIEQAARRLGVTVGAIERAEFRARKRVA